MAEIIKTEFEKTKDGRQTHLYTMTNKHGAKVEICDWGGIIRSIYVPDRAGALVDVVLGYAHLSGNEESETYFGALIGRVGNRIADGRFTLNGTEYNLNRNNGQNHLHGGICGFNNKLWDVDVLDGALKFQLKSEDMEEGYPGTMQVTVWYRWSEDNTLTIEYKAVSDKDTLCNLTNHSYFNLAGHGSGTILEHEMMLNADAFLPTNDTLIPTGMIESVKGTPFDFRKFKKIGANIADTNEQLRIGKGYDHNFVLRKSEDTFPIAAEVYSRVTGIKMICRTDQPGIQFYSGNYISTGDPEGKNGVIYNANQGFALETQNFPDAVNHPTFPSPILRKGQIYHTVTSYQFCV